MSANIDHALWVLAWSVAALSAAVFLPFGWAVRGHFVKQGSLPRGMLMLSLASLVVYGCMFVVLGTRPLPPSRIESVAALALMAAAGGLFWWAIATTRARRLHLAHSGNRSNHVEAAGPYGWIRHPFYTAYMVFWIGTAILAGGWQWLPVLMLVGWYVSVARNEEQQFQSSAMADAYADYRARTGMVVPRLRSVVRRG